MDNTYGDWNTSRDQHIAIFASICWSVRWVAKVSAVYVSSVYMIWTHWYSESSTFSSYSLTLLSWPMNLSDNNLMNKPTALSLSLLYIHFLLSQNIPIFTDRFSQANSSRVFSLHDHWANRIRIPTNLRTSKNVMPLIGSVLDFVSFVCFGVLQNIITIIIYIKQLIWSRNTQRKRRNEA